MLSALCCLLRCTNYYFSYIFHIRMYVENILQNKLISSYSDVDDIERVHEKVNSRDGHNQQSVMHNNANYLLID